MKTKKDFWKTIIYAYLAIFSGIIILLANPGDSKTQIYFLLAVILLEVLGIIIIQKALKIYRSLDDKSISRVKSFAGMKVIAKFIPK